MRSMPVVVVSVMAMLGGVLVLWARSYLGETLLIESAKGQLLLIGIDGPTTDVTQSREAARLESFLSKLLLPPKAGVPSPPQHRLLGFSLVTGQAGAVTISNPNPRGGFHTERYPFLIIGLPYWSLAMFAGVLLAWCVWQRHRLSKRRRRGHCLTCGYDIRATPDRCPECGAVPVKPPHNPPL